MAGLAELAKRYRKFLVAAAAGIVAFAGVAADGSVNGDDLWVVVAAILGPFGVAILPNKPKEPSIRS